MSQSSNMMVKACILSLASNVEPSENLAFAKIKIQTLGDSFFSTIITNPATFSPATENSVQNSPAQKHPTQNVPTYHNQVVYLAFDKPMNYFELVKLTKNLEQQANREQFNKPLVTLDVDILAVNVDKSTTDLLDKQDKTNEQFKDEKGEPFLTFDFSSNSLNPSNSSKGESWLGVARRFPLADYDRQGIDNLAKNQDLVFLGEL